MDVQLSEHKYVPKYIRLNTKQYMCRPTNNVAMAMFMKCITHPTHVILVTNKVYIAIETYNKSWEVCCIGPHYAFGPIQHTCLDLTTTYTIGSNLNIYKTKLIIIFRIVLLFMIVLLTCVATTVMKFTVQSI